MRTQKKEIDITHGPLAGKILAFALPLAATGILQQLFNAADVAVVGQFAGARAMAAVGSNSPIIGLLVNLFAGIALGANIIIAQAIGRGDVNTVKKAVHNSILIALVSGVLLGLLGEVIARRLLILLAVPEEILGLSTLYLRIYFLGMPFILLYNFLSAIFRSYGNTRAPLLCLVTGGIVNVVLNLVFVLGLGRSVDGVAIATIVSNLISSVMLFVALMRTDSVLKIDFRAFKPDLLVIRRIFAIGVPAGIQGMVFSLSNVVIQSAINSLGTTVMAASSAAFNVEILAYYVINAFGQACTTFTGQNFGAGRYDRCRKSTQICFFMDLLFCIVISGSLLLFAEPILGLFNGDPQVIATGKIRLLYILAAEPVNVVMEILSGALRGYGRSLPPALITVIGVVGSRLSWIWLVFPHIHSFTGIMTIYPISWVITAVSIFIYYMIYRRSQKYAAASAA